MSNTYLLAKALAYAIVAIELRPETIREQSDYDDMVVLFRKLPASERKCFSTRRGGTSQASAKLFPSRTCRQTTSRHRTTRCGSRQPQVGRGGGLRTGFCFVWTITS